MALTVTHAHVSAITDDGSDVGSNAWNANHTLAGSVNYSELTGGQATLALGTITANAAALTITGTWNNAAVTFDAPLFMNITNTASAAGSLLADLQVGSATKFSVDVAGHVLSTAGYSATTVNFGVGAANTGLSSSGGNIFLITSGNTRAVIDGSQAAFAINSTWGFAWSSSSVDAASADTFLWRQAAATIAQVNGTNAQAFRVYNTSDTNGGAPTNYERGVIDWTTTANTLTIGAQAGGTGTLRQVFITSNLIDFRVNNGSGAFDYGITHSGNNFNFNTSFVILSSATRLTFNLDTGISRVAPLVMMFDNGAGGGVPASYFQWGGQARVTSDFSVTSSTVLVNVTGLSVAVAAGRTYAFEAELYVTDAAAGGVQAAIAGTATATAIQYTGYTIADNAIKGKTNATALATAVGSTVTTETSGIVVRITGIITVNAAGTLTVQMAQNTSNGTATIAKRGSRFIVHDMP